jgi:hypothetical protein
MILPFFEPNLDGLTNDDLAVVAVVAWFVVALLALAHFTSIRK